MNKTSETVNDQLKFFGIIITILLSLYSCDKHVYKYDEIIIGDHSGLIVSDYDTLIVGGYHQQNKFDIDINKDNINDVSVISEIWGSPGIGQYPLSKIWCLHDNIGFQGYYTNDTLFVRSSTQIQEDNGTVYVHYYFQHSCFRMNADDSVRAVYIDVFKTEPKDINQCLHTSDLFNPDSISINSLWRSTSVDYSEDTVFTWNNIYLNDCISFPPDDIKYIGLKMRTGNTEKLGWIKLSIFDKYKILIFETAVQL